MANPSNPRVTAADDLNAFRSKMGKLLIQKKDPVFARVTENQVESFCGEVWANAVDDCLAALWVRSGQETDLGPLTARVTAVESSVSTLQTAKADISSPVFSGVPRAPTAATSTTSEQIATTRFVKNQGYAPRVSPSFLGSPTAPTAGSTDNSTRIATTAFVKNVVGSGVGGFAPLNSPVFTGVPQAPTAATSTNTDQIATTKFVKNQGYVQPASVSLAIAQATAGLAPINSPSFTGQPKAPTPPLGNNSTDIATTAYVRGQQYATIFGPALQGAATAVTPLNSDNSSRIATTAFVKNTETARKRFALAAAAMATYHMPTVNKNQTSYVPMGWTDGHTVVGFRSNEVFYTAIGGVPQSIGTTNIFSGNTKVAVRLMGTFGYIAKLDGSNLRLINFSTVPPGAGANLSVNADYANFSKSNRTNKNTNQHFIIYGRKANTGHQILVAQSPSIAVGPTTNIRTFNTWRAGEYIIDGMDGEVIVATDKYVRISRNAANTFGSETTLDTKVKDVVADVSSVRTTGPLFAAVTEQRLYYRTATSAWNWIDLQWARSPTQITHLGGGIFAVASFGDIKFYSPFMTEKYLDAEFLCPIVNGQAGNIMSSCAMVGRFSRRLMFMQTEGLTMGGPFYPLLW